MRVEVERALEGDRELIGNLAQLYFHDMSEFAPRDVDSQGHFAYEYLDNYWSDDNRYPFLFRVDGSPAGFALVRVIDGGITDMAEFFVVRAHRRAGVGAVAAKEVFAMFPGPWQVRQEPLNFGAQRFWREVIREYTAGEFEDHEGGLADHQGPAQTFTSRRTPDAVAAAEEA